MAYQNSRSSYKGDEQHHSKGSGSVAIIHLTDGTDCPEFSDDQGQVVVQIPKIVREYPLPGSRQTHEMVQVSSTMLVVTQQPNSVLVKVQLCPDTGRPVACASFCIGNVWAGVHGLSASKAHPGYVWAAVQYKSFLALINVGGNSASTPPQLLRVIHLPPEVSGPHCMCDCGPDLWVGCKDSDHVLQINYEDILKIKDKDSSGKKMVSVYPHQYRYSCFPCSRRPLFIAVHPTSRDVYASLDFSNKIWRHVPSKHKAKLDATTEIDIPPGKGTGPCGMVQGPDGNVWFTLVGGAAGGTGTFARIFKDGTFQWFSLATPLGAHAGLAHLAFDWEAYLEDSPNHVATKCNLGCKVRPFSDLTFWLLGTSQLVADESQGTDAVFTVTIDNELGRITDQQSIVLPTPRCAAHRILPLHKRGLFVTQLKVCSLAHITGTAVLNPSQLSGETSDFYQQFGLGQSHLKFKFSEHIDENVYTQTR